MTRLRVTSVAVLALAALAAPGARAQSPPAPQPGVCDPVRYGTLRDIQDESRTYEQEMEFEALQRACADTAVDNLRHARAARPQSANVATKSAPTPHGPRVLGRPLARAADLAVTGAVTSGREPVPDRPMSPAEVEAAALRAADVPETPGAAATPVRPAWHRAPLRRGFWISAGLGWGTAGCSDCGPRQSGLSAGLSLGATLSEHVQLGVSSNGWTKSEEGGTTSTGAVTGLVKLYPFSRGGFYLLGGAGVSAFHVSAGTLAFSSTTTGEAAVAGLGYDVRLARTLSLTPFATGVGMRFDAGDYNFAQVGLAVTFH